MGMEVAVQALMLLYILVQRNGARDVSALVYCNRRGLGGYFVSFVGGEREQVEATEVDDEILAI